MKQSGGQIENEKILRSFFWENTLVAIENNCKLQLNCSNFCFTSGVRNLQIFISGLVTKL